MSLQRGSDMILSLQDDMVSEVFLPVLGLQNKSLSLSNSGLKTTDITTSGWRSYLPEMGASQARLTGSGVFLSDHAGQILRRVFFKKEHRIWRILIPELGIVEGRFRMAALSYSGPYAGEMSVSLTLLSTNELTFTEGT